MPSPIGSTPQLSVAMIARNCAAELRGTLESINDLAEELVVLDTGSTDDTPRIAQEFGARVIRRPWDDDFSAARNACLAHARGDWILWLDAGEQLSAESLASLGRLLAQPLDQTRAFLLPVVLPQSANELSSEQKDQIRLHPRAGGLCFAGRVRESLDASLRPAGLTTDILEIPIHRLAADLDAATLARRARRNIRLADLAIAECGPTSDMHNCLGEAWQKLGGWLQAAQHYARALRLSAGGSREALEALYGLLSCLDAAGADRQVQLSLAMQALGQFPLDAHLLVAAGGYLYDLEQSPLAIRALDLAFRHGQVERRLWHLADIRQIAAQSAAKLLLASGRAEEAATLLAAAVRLWPDSKPLADQWSEAVQRAGRRQRFDAAQSTQPAPLAAAGLNLRSNRDFA